MAQNEQLASPCIQSQSQIPECFLCPITGSIMVDPIIVAETGFSYERTAIEKWLLNHDTDPTTNVKLGASAHLVPNRALRHCIAAVRDLDWKTASDQADEVRQQTEKLLTNESSPKQKGKRQQPAGPSNNESIVLFCIRCVIVTSCFGGMLLADQILAKGWSVQPKALLALFVSLQVFSHGLAITTWHLATRIQFLWHLFEVSGRRNREEASREYLENANKESSDAGDARLRCLRTIQVPDGGGVKALSLRGNRLLSTSGNYEVRAWDLHSWRCVKVLQGCVPEVWSIAHHDILVTGAMQHRLSSYGIASPLELGALPPLPEATLACSTSSTPAPPGGCCPVCAAPPSRQGTDGGCGCGVACQGAARPGPLAMVVHGRWIFAAAVDCSVGVHDRRGATMSCIARLEAHTGWVRAMLCVQPAEDQVRNGALRSERSSSSGEGDSCTEMWEAATEQNNGGPPGLITASNDWTVCVWRAGSDARRGGREWARERKLSGHTGAVVSLLLHRGCLFSSSADSSVRVWRAGGEWEALQVLEGHVGTVWCTAAQGGLLITGAHDSTVKVWAVRSVSGAGAAQAPADSAEHEAEVE